MRSATCSVRTARSVMVAVLTLFALAACSGDDSPATTAVESSTSASSPVVDADTRDEAVTALTSGVIVPAFENLESSVGELATSVDALCVAPADQAALVAARDAWRAARVSWMTTRAFRFGPVMDLRAMSKIDFPVDPEKVSALVTGTDPLDAASLNGLGADQRGLGAVELLLFIDDDITPRECEMAASAISLISEMASEVAVAWRDEPLTDTKEFVDGIVNGSIFALVDVGDQQLGKASGDVSGVPEFAEVDDGPAKSALDDIAAILVSVTSVVDGGLGALTATISPDAAEKLPVELAATIAAVASVPAPMADTVDTAPLSAAYSAAQPPLRTLRAEVASLLGVTLTLGDADGDS